MPCIFKMFANESYYDVVFPIQLTGSGKLFIPKFLSIIECDVTFIIK